MWNTISNTKLPQWKYDKLHPNSLLFFPFAFCLAGLCSLRFTSFSKVVWKIQWVCCCHENRNRTVTSANYCMASLPIHWQEGAKRNKNILFSLHSTRLWWIKTNRSLVSNPFAGLWCNLATESWELPTKFLVPVAKRWLDFFEIFRALLIEFFQVYVVFHVVPISV